jgi:hypothetical protein
VYASGASAAVPTVQTLRSFSSSTRRATFAARATGTYSSAPAADFVHARAFARAYDRAEVARVFYAVEHDGERRRSLRHTRGEQFEQLVCVRVSDRRDAGDDALMIRARREPLQFRTRRTPHGDAARPRQLEQLVQPRRLRALCDRDALDAPPARAQGFDDGQHAVKLARARLRLCGRMLGVGCTGRRGRAGQIAPSVACVRRAARLVSAWRFHVSVRGRSRKCWRSRP